MENINIGIATLLISNKLQESYLNDNLIVESKKIATDFFKTVKNSPILQLEFKVFDNLETKCIENEILAKEYIDNNIKLFEVYTLEEIEAERAKLNDFISEDVLSMENEKIDLYNAINTLITESLKISNDIDVDILHESFALVLNHVKTEKKSLLENVDVELINEDVVEIAINKFNEKYNSLDENDSSLLKTLIKSNTKEKKELLETYKTDTLTILESIDKENVKDNIIKAIQKIKEMAYDQKNVNDNIIGLHELKKELL